MIMHNTCAQHVCTTLHNTMIISCVFDIPTCMYIGLSAIAGVAIGANAVTSGLRWALTSAVRQIAILFILTIINTHMHLI
jgi:hypothetical protein